MPAFPLPLPVPARSNDCDSDDTAAPRGRRAPRRAAANVPPKRKAKNSNRNCG